MDKRIPKWTKLLLPGSIFLTFDINKNIIPAAKIAKIIEINISLNTFFFI